MSKAKSGSSALPKSGSAKARGRKAAVEKIGDLDHFFNLLVLDLDASGGTAEVQYAIDRQKSRMRKRVEVDRPELEIECLKDFVRTNAEMHMFDAQSLDETILGEARQFIYHVLRKQLLSVDKQQFERGEPDDLSRFLYEPPANTVFSRSFILDNWRLGPKASNGVEGVGVVEKVGQAWTYTESCESYLRAIRMQSPYLMAIDGMEDGLLPIDGSKTTAVPKNEEALRIICGEPSGNMLLQLAGGRFIELALTGIGLNIHTQQPKNRRLACRGSIDGSVCTVDLKSGSDRGARSMIHRLWPEEWVSFFEKVRCATTYIPKLKKDVQLGMMSTMGNGFTFPVMTLTLLALVYANRRVNHNGRHNFVDWSSTAVFGDDIIVPTEEYHTLREVLENFGYIVNNDKSFFSGRFRESCGGDYFGGVDVTPFYVRRLATESDVYVVMNQLLDWSSKIGVPLVRSLRYLRSLVEKPCIVPGWCNPDSGVRLAQAPRRYKYLKPYPMQRELLNTIIPRPWARGIMAMPLAIGGFLNGIRDKEQLRGNLREETLLKYAVHDEWVTYKLRDAVIPSGFTDGWSPELGGPIASAYRSLVWELAGF